MNIAQLDRLFTAVARKHHAKSFVVIDSLSVLGLVNERPIPESMTISAEVDAYPESDPDLAFEIADGFGLGSDFEQEHGYYFDGSARLYSRKTMSERECASPCGRKSPEEE